MFGRDLCKGCRIFCSFCSPKAPQALEDPCHPSSWMGKMEEIITVMLNHALLFFPCCLFNATSDIGMWETPAQVSLLCPPLGDAALWIILSEQHLWITFPELYRADHRTTEYSELERPHEDHPVNPGPTQGTINYCAFLYVQIPHSLCLKNQQSV